MQSPRLHADTSIAVAAPIEIMNRLREHFVEHGAVTGTDAAWRVDFTIGSAVAEARPDRIEVRVEAGDTTSLAYLQWGVAEHVCEFALGEAPEIVWRGGTTPGAPLPYFREMTVVEARQVTPRMRRVTLAGRDLARFARHGMHVRLLLPPARGVRPVWPVMAADGRQAWPEGPRPVSRVYTIRRIDVARGLIDVDFVLHEGEETPGATFALEAAEGAAVGMTGPGGVELPDAGTYVLAGDETALPAISRMIEEMPARKRIVALVEIADGSERQELEGRADLELHWLSRDGRPAGSTTLLQDAVRGVLPGLRDEPVFVFARCEQTAARALRAHLRGPVGLPRTAWSVAAYWRRGAPGDTDLDE
ncbi:DUF2218 domain-containing protein [Faunimonas sp. B44]|uniref:DUF2218 domain-containing protein n=1 Tax=Faunimonas sp. B44 TaxID=3461493 RepID=UPI00404504F4